MEVVTQFASAERATQSELKRQRTSCIALPQLQEVLDAVPQAILVLNRQRQIVHANQALLELVGVDDADSVVGLRPGELLGCLHAGAEAGCGCGTTEFCRECGAVNAILTSQRGGADTRNCHIRLKRSAETLDLRVRATPFKTGGQDFTLFAVSDVSHENRRLALERIFFHDILNLAGNVRGLAQLLSVATSEEAPRYLSLVRQVSEELMEGIRAQAELVSAERGDLRPEPAAIDVSAFLEKVTAPYANGHSGGACVIVEGASRRVMLVSDETLLARVLGNMLKNALEASEHGDVVRTSFEVKGDCVEFWVHNGCTMTREVQLQIFQRSFSTKGSGRGLGTYSMKLLAEKYLQGTLQFESSREAGTTFRARFPLAFPGYHSC